MVYAFTTDVPIDEATYARIGAEMGDEPMSPREQFENDRTRFHERLAGLERVLADLIDKHLITPGVGWRCLDDMLNCGSLWYVNAAYWCESNNTWPDPPERNKT